MKVKYVRSSPVTLAFEKVIRCPGTQDHCDSPVSTVYLRQVYRTCGAGRLDGGVGWDCEDEQLGEVCVDQGVDCPRPGSNSGQRIGNET